MNVTETLAEATARAANGEAESPPAGLATPPAYEAAPPRDASGVAGLAAHAFLRDAAVVSANPNGAASADASGAVYALSADKISVRFGATHALHGVSLAIRRGEVLALLGPNGAGKTTMAQVLQGALTPTSGRVTYYGKTAGSPPRAKPANGEIGYFPSDSSLYRTLPIDRVLYHAGVRRGLPEATAEEVANQWLARLGLTPRAHTALGNLSRGNQQKVQFAEAVVHAPAVLLLDEPFANLDPLNQELFLTLIREVQARGTAVLLSDHQMPLVERVANRLCILNQGRVLALGTLQELRARVRPGQRVRLRLANQDDVQTLHVLYDHAAVRRVELAASGEVRVVAGEEVHPMELLNFVKTRVRVSEILSEPANLHDIYVHCLNGEEEG